MYTRRGVAALWVPEVRKSTTSSTLSKHLRIFSVVFSSRRISFCCCTVSFSYNIIIIHFTHVLSHFKNDKVYYLRGDSVSDLQCRHCSCIAFVFENNPGQVCFNEWLAMDKPIHYVLLQGFVIIVNLLSLASLQRVMAV